LSPKEKKSGMPERSCELSLMVDVTSSYGSMMA
jgi:hypothetical protein